MSVHPIESGQQGVEVWGGGASRPAAATAAAASRRPTASLLPGARCRVNWRQSLRFGVVGLTLHGPFFYHAYRWLDSRFGTAATLQRVRCGCHGSCMGVTWSGRCRETCPGGQTTDRQCLSHAA